MSHRATVLVVDDDPDTVDTMREILSEEGHTVLCAMNGMDALALARTQRPDLVLLDLVMPVMDGRAFLSALRLEPGLANLHVVVLSGSDGAAELACETLKKPLRLRALLELIQRVADAATEHEDGPCDRPSRGQSPQNEGGESR